MRRQGLELPHGWCVEVAIASIFSTVLSCGALTASAIDETNTGKPLFVDGDTSEISVLVNVDVADNLHGKQQPYSSITGIYPTLHSVSFPASVG